MESVPAIDDDLGVRAGMSTVAEAPRPALARPLDLSVVVPVYNERHLVETSVRRLLAVEHPSIRSLQVIAVDDRSTDGSYAVLQRIQADDPRVLLLRHEHN